MIAEALRRSPLADYRERFVALSTASRGNLHIRELPYLVHVNFRTDPIDASAMHGLASSLLVRLGPLRPEPVSESPGDHRTRQR